MIKAKYTVVLKNIIDDPLLKPKLDEALSTYPIYQKKSIEEYIPSIVPTRQDLNAKILNFYKYREIGFETIGRFLDELETSMIEIMPKYNQLFFSADQDYNILYNVDYERITNTARAGESTNEIEGTESTTTTSEEAATSNTEESTSSTIENSDNTTSNSEVNSNSKSVEASQPQSSISTPASNIDSLNYADKITWNKGTSTDASSTEGSGTTESTGAASTDSTSSTAGSGTTAGTNSAIASGANKEDEETTERTIGNFGVMATQDLIQKYRDLIVNIEQQIINDERVSELFMRVY